ncbi:hypothetical protein K466DRAFT_569570 [Polyporus arcularius HHB13444]|uniref:Uncharacterized protein n=1 Tax=Polyporus arcularius HHB13444 TaxID=1314778 RepID=A0A5C3P458_9APHY|nr:hypothetical protein K466DRAFT_569570 [Polyporus arcularius HHB13444]
MTSAHDSLGSPATPRPRIVNNPGSPTPRPTKKSEISGMLVFGLGLDKSLASGSGQQSLPVPPAPLKLEHIDLKTLLSRDTVTLLDCLQAERPKLAVPYKKDALKDTKGTTRHELDTVDVPLRTIVTCPRTFDDIVRQAQEMLKGFVLDLRKQEDCMFAAHVIPGLINPVLSSGIFSEADVVINRTGVGFRPAIAVLRFLKECEQQPSTSDSTPTKGGKAPVTPNKTPGFVKREILPYPYFSSALNVKIIPDLQLVVGEGDTSMTREVPMTVEFKSSNVWDRAQFDALLAPELVEPHAVHFEWPQTVGKDHTKQCRVIVQIWSQMSHAKCKFGIISAEHMMSIFMREGDVLYMSRAYDQEEKSALRIVAASMAAMGMTIRMPKMPDAEQLRESWPNVKQSELEKMTLRPGIYEPTLHEVQRRIIAERKSREGEADDHDVCPQYRSVTVAFEGTGLATGLGDDFTKLRHTWIVVTMRLIVIQAAHTDFPSAGEQVPEHSKEQTRRGRRKK